MTGSRPYPPSARLRRSSEIREMFRSDRRSCGPLDVFVRPAGAVAPRVGIVVPKHGRTIVERNRLKRRLREILRTEWLPAERERAAEGTGGRDLLVRARPAAYAAGFEELARAVRSCLAPGR